MVGIINDGQGVLFLVSFGPREEQHLGGLKKKIISCSYSVIICIGGQPMGPFLLLSYSLGCSGLPTLLGRLWGRFIT